jgi:hypothetical protein
MEPSPSTAQGGFFSSPRAQRRLMWLSAGVLLLGLIVFLIAFLGRGSPGIQSPLSTVAAQHQQKQVKAPPDPRAFKVARRFMETAVLRKNLDSAYPLVNQEIKGGMSKKQWDTGNIAVQPYPANNAKTAGFQVIWSYKTQMMLLVDLVARKGSQVRPHLPFWLGLERAGNKPSGRWLVNYWVPDWSPPVPLAGGG